MKKTLQTFNKKRADKLLAQHKPREAMLYYRKAGDLEGMARAALEAGDLQAAAGYYIEAEKPQLAIETLDKLGDLPAALELCRKHGLKEKAACLYHKMGLHDAAAEIYMELNLLDPAIEEYRLQGNIAGLALAHQRKGNLAQAAAEYLKQQNKPLAALLYEMNGDREKAAALYRETGLPDKALELYREIGDLRRVADIHKAAGRLRLAAETYAELPDGSLDAAEIFSKLILLAVEAELEPKSVVLSGSVAPAADTMAIGTVGRTLMIANRDFHPLWVFKISGIGRPRLIALNHDATRIVVANEAPAGEKEHNLLLLDREKNLLWEKKMPDPVRDLTFMPGETAILAAVGDRVICLDLDGNPKWENHADFKPWTVCALPQDHLAAAGTLGGALSLCDENGKEVRSKQMEDRIHAVRLAPNHEDLAVVCGDRTLALLSKNLEEKWRVTLDHHIHYMVSLPGADLFALAGENILALVNLDGERIDAASMESRVQACFADQAARTIYLALADSRLLRFGLHDCRRRAAECYVKAGELAKAADIYYKIEDYPSAYELYKEIGDFEKAAGTIHLTGDVQKAARHYEVVEQFEKAADLYVEIGQEYQAAKCYGRAGLQVKAAELYEKLGDKLLAADFYERAGHFKKAGFLFAEVNQPERALETLLKEYATRPEDPEIILKLGNLCLQTERYDDAIKYFQIAVQNEALRREALCLLGESFMQKALYDVAIDRFEECLGGETKPTRANIDIYYNIGCCHERAGRFTEAKEVFGKVLAIDYYYKDIQERLKQSQVLSSVRAGEKIEKAPEEAVAAPEASKALLRYKIIRKLGEGGMGVVYLAHDAHLDRKVAWKVLPAHLAGNEEYQLRLLREARAAAQLSHRNIVSIYDVVTEAGHCSITMEYIEGATLRAKMVEAQHLSLAAVLRYARQIAEALAVAHHAGVIHRDVKPENILVDGKTDEIKVTDFGLARLADDIQLTQEGCVVGTVSYMAPEQIRAGKLDHRVDIYAFGVLLFEMLAGRAPYIGANILAQHLHNQPPDLREFRQDIPDPIEKLVAKCLEKSPDARPPMLDLVASEITKATSGLSDALDSFHNQKTLGI